jgi:thioredoxin 1
MNPPPNIERVSPPWLLIIGLLLGGSLLVFMAWDSISGSFHPAGNSGPGSPHVVHLTEANWEKEVVQSKVPVLVDFTAKWCGPCQMLAPTIDKLADRYQGKVKIAKFDVGNQQFDKGGKMMAQYGLERAIPHVMLFKNGEPRAQFPGGQTREAEFAAAIDRLLQ